MADIKQGQYIITDKGTTGWYIGEVENQTLIQFEESTLGWGWDTMANDKDKETAEGYKFHPNDNFLYHDDISPHCGEAEELCDKCRESLGLAEKPKYPSPSLVADFDTRASYSVDWGEGVGTAIWHEYRPVSSGHCEPDPNHSSLSASSNDYMGNCTSGGSWSSNSNNEDTIMDKIKRIPSTLKRHLNGKLQAQYQAGLINGDLALTQEGEKALIEILQAEFEDKLSERAEEIIAEIKDEE